METSLRESALRGECMYTQPLRINYNLSYEHEHRKRRNCCYYSLPNGANIAWLYQSDDTSFELRGLMRYTSKAFTAWRPFNVGNRYVQNLLFQNYAFKAPSFGWKNTTMAYLETTFQFSRTSFGKCKLKKVRNLSFFDIFMILRAWF